MNEEKAVVKKIDGQAPASPEAAVDYASRCARLLKNVVRSAGLSKKFSRDGREYLMHEAWQTIGRFYHAQAEIEWSRRVVDGYKCIGWEARAVVRADDGRIISAAESMCCRDEDAWKARPEYAIRSMAQTRAAAKALRQAFSWVAVLAGYAPTPAEEMDAEFVAYQEDQQTTIPPQEPPPQEPPRPAENSPAPEATQAQRRAIFARLRAAGLDGEQAKAFISWALESAGLENLTKKYASAILDDFDGMVEAFLEQHHG